MYALAGLVGAAITVAGTRLIVGLTTANLPRPTADASLVALLVLASLVGFLAGSAIYRRAGRSRHQLGLFASLTGGFAGGVLGCSLAFTVTFGYLSSYSSWPSDRVGQALLLLAYPLFSALGLCVGALLGLVIGLLCGGLLRLTPVAR